MNRFPLVALALLLLAAAPDASAQDWPARQPIKIVVPFSAGSATDITARTVFEQVGRQIGQTFVVENRGGAGTTLGMAQAAKAEPDGYTMLVHSTSHVVVASTYAKLPFNVAEDFAGVSALASIPFVVATATRYKTLKDLIDARQEAWQHHPLRHGRCRKLGPAVHGALSPRRRISRRRTCRSAARPKA